MSLPEIPLRGFPSQTKFYEKVREHLKTIQMISEVQGFLYWLYYHFNNLRLKIGFGVRWEETSKCLVILEKYDARLVPSQRLKCRLFQMTVKPSHGQFLYEESLFGEFESNNS